nr:putative serine/threonine-protein kinase/receptor [Quercus suber]
MQTENSLEVIAGGTTGLIKLRAGNTYVEKAPYPDSSDAYLSARDIRREYNAYQRLPEHARLLRPHSDSTPEALVLPYLRNGCLHDFLRDRPVSSAQRIQFSADASEGLHLLHCAGIVHGDINSWNFLIDDDFRLCIIDFAGSKIDGKAGSAFEGVRYCLPRLIDDPSTVRTDLFALGSLLYEIATSEEPYHEGHTTQPNLFTKTSKDLGLKVWIDRSACLRLDERLHRLFASATRVQGHSAYKWLLARFPWYPATSSTTIAEKWPASLSERQLARFSGQASKTYFFCRLDSSSAALMTFVRRGLSSVDLDGAEK